MTVEIRIIHKFEPFVLGKCSCGCNQEILIYSKRHKVLRRFVNHHHTRGKNHYDFKGKVKHEKYWLIYDPDHIHANKQGYVREHIKIFTDRYQCCLLKWGIVHHIIPVKEGGTNNIINLQGMTRKQHMLHHNITSYRTKFGRPRKKV